MKYKAAIFDLNGTIIDSFSRTEYEKVLREMAAVLNADYDEFSRIWLGTFQERVTGKIVSPRGILRFISENTGIAATDEEIEKAARIRLEYAARHIVPRPGSVEAIRWLKREGYKTGLITDCTYETPEIWPETAFASLFDAEIFSCLAGTRKPDPRIYRMATDKLGVEPGECIYIGDGSSNELSGALSAGMYPVMIRVPGESFDNIFDDRETGWTGPVITSLTEVRELL